MSSLFAIIQEETFNQWQMKKKIQQKILNDIFYNWLNKKEFFVMIITISVLFFPLQKTK